MSEMNEDALRSNDQTPTYASVQELPAYPEDRISELSPGGYFQFKCNGSLILVFCDWRHNVHMYHVLRKVI